jgi:hypothetical protein
MKAYKHLVKHVLATGGDITVWDGGDDPAEEHCDQFKKIIDAIEAVEEASIYIFKDGATVGWARIVPFGLEDEETLVDYSANEFFTVWEEMYDRHQRGLVL